MKCAQPGSALRHLAFTVGCWNAAAAVALVMAMPTWAAESVPASVDTHIAMDTNALTRPRPVDLDSLAQLHLVRILVPYSRTFFFNDAGRYRGVTAEMVSQFERFINNRYVSPSEPITVAIVPVTRDKLLPWLKEGRGDIAAANLTITEERLTQVDFAEASDATVNEIIVTASNVPPLSSLDDLSGKRVYVRRMSSYYESLVSLHRRFLVSGRPGIQFQLVPNALEDEDLMEMADSGLVGIIVVDDWKASIWSTTLTNLTLYRNLVVRAEGKVGWAFRKKSPVMASVVGEFLASARRDRLTEQQVAAYARLGNLGRNPVAATNWAPVANMLQIFQKYGNEYGFDPLLLAAQGYQESKLNQRVRSRAGAIGVMQIMPETAKAMDVGDIRRLEPNIHAGTKYMRRLIDVHFKDVPFDEQNRTLFAFASYNAGPTRVAKLRQEAKDRGLDPNTWFNNVEYVASDRVGQETVTYVRNIYKFYAAYKFEVDAKAEQQRASDTMRTVLEPAQ
jgi:membrane-bound lytic murein transglycosylase MltF